MTNLKLISEASGYCQVNCCSELLLCFNYVPYNGVFVPSVIMVSTPCQDCSRGIHLTGPLQILLGS